MSNDTILIVDDEVDLLQGLKRMIEAQLSARVLMADNGPDALDMIGKHPVDVVLTDIRMPTMDGMTLLRKIQKIDNTITVLIMTAFGTVERAVEAIKSGAFDLIQKPFEEDRLIHLIKNGLERNSLVRENTRLLKALNQQTRSEKMVGRSGPMRAVFKKIDLLSQTDITVLVRGETGTGKELAARTIHARSNRCGEKMVTVNCPALPETILESELFGYKKGAFTNATTDKIGLFDHAQGGTIFLDEIGDLPPVMQAKLLRVLQDKRITPLGDTSSHEVDVRVIAATNQDLEKKIDTHGFREDLYYRLNVASLTMPPLREIKEDLPFLLAHFLEKIAHEVDIPPKFVRPKVIDELQQRTWPGNMRELENTVREWYALIPATTITLADLNLRPDRRSISQIDGSHNNAIDITQPYKQLKAEAIDGFTRRYLNRLLSHTNGNVSFAAQLSGIKRQSLQKIIRRYDISADHFRH